MSHRQIMLKYFGWCPGFKDASRFNTGVLWNTLTFPRIRTISYYYLFSVLAALMYFPQLLYISRKTISGLFVGEDLLKIVSIFIVFFSMYWTIGWLKPIRNHTIELNVKNLVLFGFIFYSLGHIWISVYDMDYWAYYLLPNFNDLRDLIQSLWVYQNFIGLFIGLTLLRLTVNILLDKRESRNSRLATMVFIGLGIAGAVGASKYLVHIYINWVDYYVNFNPTVLLANIVSYYLPSLGFLLIGYSFYRHKELSCRIMVVVLAIWILVSIYPMWFVEARTPFRTMLYRVFNPIPIFSQLHLPSPGIVSILLIIVGLMLNLSGFGTRDSLKAIYSTAILSAGVANLWYIIHLPDILIHYLIGLRVLLDSGIPYPQFGNFPGQGEWAIIHQIGLGIILLLIGALCLSRDETIKSKLDGIK